MEDDVADQFYDDYEEFSSLTGEVALPSIAAGAADDSGHVMEDSATDLSTSSSHNSLDLSISTVKSSLFFSFMLPPQRILQDPRKSPSKTRNGLLKVFHVDSVFDNPFESARVSTGLQQFRIKNYSSIKKKEKYPRDPERILKESHNFFFLI